MGLFHEGLNRCYKGGGLAGVFLWQFGCMLDNNGRYY